MPNARRTRVALAWRITGLLISSAILFDLAATERAFSAQGAPPELQSSDAEVASEKPAGPARVEIEPAARDDEIRRRILDILKATGWFPESEVAVNEGVVFLDGRTSEERFKEWAGDLARSTDGVVAVVNRMRIVRSRTWDFAPAQEEFWAIADGLIRALPLILVSLVVLLMAWAGGRLARPAVRRMLRRRINSQLLLEVAARAVGMLVFLLGLYLVLRFSGLTRLAVTLIGGTGLLGLVVGIAFRDITENFLASLFLSLQQPFRGGDLVEVANVTGYVQRLTSRTTILMTLDGNQVQIPNSTVFKSTIRNFTSNSNRREDFVVGVGYDASIPRVQQIALDVLYQHPAVLRDPEPWVLVDDLGASTVRLRVYFWLDGREHSWLKVRSSVIRLVKRALQDAGISLPDEAREVIFPDGVTVRLKEEAAAESPHTTHSQPERETSEAVSTAAEADLRSEASAIRKQALQSWNPDHGEDLLAGDGIRGRSSSRDKSAQPESR